MQLFHRSTHGEVAALVDIGSASVLVAYVYTALDKPVPEVVWSHREHLPLRNGSDTEQLAKNLLSSLMNAAIALETTGRKVLEASLGGYGHEVKEMFVSVAAPWSYTVNKSISYTADEPFSLTRDLLDELSHTAETKTAEELKGQEEVHSLGLSVTSRTTAAILANSYPITHIAGQKVTTVSVSRISGVVQTFLVHTLEELRDKTFPRATLHIHPFMVGYYATVRSLIPESTEMALVDVTYEATEVGIIRDGVLQYCTHAAYGAYSLARDLAQEKQLSPEEALGQLQHPEELTGEESARLNDQYTAILADLFRETGDRLSIPKTVYLHCPGNLSSYLEKRLVAAGSSAASGELFVTPFTKELTQKLPLAPTHDTALLVSLWFFHIQKTQNMHTWL